MVRSLHTVPDTPPRAVLYLRQSVSRDDSISLDLQEAAGREYCSRQGYQVVAVESDPGISGRTWNRPAVQRTIAMIEDSTADVIVLWKWSRLSRSRRDWAIAADKVDVAGGRIESATEAVDVSTATGRLARGVLTEFAAFESDRIGEVWKEVHASRLANGYPPNGLPRFGYIYDPEQKLHVVDPVKGPALAEVYRRFISGETVHSIVRWLNAADITTTTDGPWSETALRRVLDAGFASGQIAWGGQLHPGRHEPVIDADTWQAYLDAKIRFGKAPPRVRTSRYLLSGLVRCGRCGGSMIANPGRTPTTASFRCSVSRARGKTACVGGSVSMRHLEGVVMDWVRAIAEKVDVADQAARRGVQRRVTAESEIAAKQRRVVQIDRALQQLTLRLAEEILAPADYRAASEAYRAERLELDERIAELGAEVRAVSVDRRGAAASLLEEWDEMPLETRRAALGAMIRRVVVVAGDRSGVPGKPGCVSKAEIEIIEV